MSKIFRKDMREFALMWRRGKALGIEPWILGLDLTMAKRARDWALYYETHRLQAA